MPSGAAGVALTEAPWLSDDWVRAALTGGNKSKDKNDAPLIDLTTLGVTTVLCYKVDMGTGIVLGVVLEKVLRTAKGLLTKK